MGSNMTLVDKAKAIAEEFEYTPQQVRNGVKEYLRLMDVGLANDGEAMTMIPTYVTKVPNGTEQGVYLAVDLGGTNFRVCSVTLKGDTTFTIAQSKVAIPRPLMVSDSKSLFSFLAKQIASFVKEHHSDHFAEDPGHHLHLGFTFSFPVDQKAVNKGYLIRWTKGFDIPDAIGKDVCALLQAEIDVLGLPVTVAALVNDTVGTLMARSYTSPGKTGTLLGAIFGTGTNGAYVEKLDRITKMTKPSADVGEYDKSTGEMVINTEWGSFDNALKVLPDTPYDRALDKISVNPGIQMFEKRVSGMFLGEILRNAILALKEDAGLFETATIKANAALNSAWSVDTSVLSYIESDDTPNYLVTRETLQRELGISGKINDDEAQAVKILAHAIGKRSARLSAVPIAAIILATGKLAPPKPNSMDVESLNLKDLSLVEQGIAAIKTAVLGKPAAALIVDAPPPVAAAEPNVAAENQTIDVGVDGSVVEFYPGFEDYVRSALRDIPEFGASGEKRVRMGIAKDGSGVGAALIALVAYKMANGLA
jgi:hexokinase